MWNVAKLKEWAECRGHKLTGSRLVHEALLAHERYWGRTGERGVDRTAAKVALDAVIEKLGEREFPSRRAGEYQGVTELRRYVEERHRQRAALLEQHRAEDRGAQAPPSEGPDIADMYEDRDR